MDILLQNLRTTFRSLRRSPAFTVVAVLTIALGVGINTAMFGLVHAVLLAPLPYPDAGQLTFITTGRVNQEGGRRPLSGPEFTEIAKGASLYSAMGAIWPAGGTIVEDGRPEPIRVGVVTGKFLSLLGVSPVRGRTFREGDEGSGAEPAMIISGELWQSRFGGGDVIGRRVRFDGGWGFPGGVYTIVGVMPAGFEMYLPLEATIPRTVDAWIPFLNDLDSASRNVFYLRVVGRVAPGTPLNDARQQVQSVAADMMKRYPGYGAGRIFQAVPLYEDVVKRAKTPLFLLQAAVALVLLIACANVANLMLVRGRARRRDVGVRLALGASRRRVLSLLLMESFTLAAVGGLLGLGIAWVSVRALPALVPDTLPRAYEASISLPVVGFSLLAIVVSGLLFGLATFVQSRRHDLVTILKSEGRSTHGGPPPRWRSTLVVAQLGLSLMLLVGAGLLIRTFANLYQADPGYKWEQVVTFKLLLPGERYGKAIALSRFTRELERNLRSIAGVETAGAINQLPLDDIPNWATPYRTRTAGAEQDAGSADARLVTPGYFETLGARLVKGRWITDQDDENQPLVLMVDERLARKTWAEADPIGQELSVLVATEAGFQVRWGRVVGVVRHIRHHQPAEEVREQVFVPFAQAPRNQMGVVVRSQLDASSLTAEITRRVAQVDPDLAPSQVRPLGSYVGAKMAPARFVMALAVLFAACSLVLACVGVYGVIAYAAAQRTSELSVRAALGAGRGELMRLVLGHGLLLTVLGLAIGLAASLGTARYLKTLLFEVTALDPVTYVGAAALLGIAALLASYIPARRAASIDPARVLRSE